MRRTTAVGVLGIAFVLTGCGIFPGFGPDPRVDAVPVSGVTCPETFEEGHAEAGLVPHGFEAVAVLRCDPYASRQDVGEVWSGVLLERLEGDLEPVLVALARSSDPRSLGPCPAIGYISPELWLEAADGTVVRVAVPTDGCGAPKPVGLDAALAALTTVDETFTPSYLVESRAANAAGCATQAGMLVLAGQDEAGELGAELIVPENGAGVGEENLVPYAMPGWPDSSAVTGALLCDYATTRASESAPVPAGDAAVFVGARELAAAEAQAIVADARLALAAPSCADVATRLVVVHPRLQNGDAASLTLELDGCRRFSDPTLRARSASAEMLMLLTPPG